MTEHYVNCQSVNEEKCCKPYDAYTYLLYVRDAKWLTKIHVGVEMLRCVCVCVCVELTTVHHWHVRQPDLSPATHLYY